jgi:hypothetical protein
MAVGDHNLRFARHLLLAEIGEVGQARLCATRARVAAAVDPRVAGVARDYLERAGIIVSSEIEATNSISEAHLEVPVLDAQSVRALAGRVELEEAAAALAGAFAAVETIKHAVGAGTAAALPPGLCLGGEVSR